MFAAMHNSEKLAKIFINKGVDKNAKDNSGKVALDYAKENGANRIVELLNKQLKNYLTERIEDAFKTS